VIAIFAKAAAALRAVPSWLWWLLAGAAAVGIIATYIESVERRGYERGRAECEARARAQVEAAAAEWARRVQAAEQAAQEQTRVIYRTGEKTREKIRVVYRNRPQQCGISADGMRALAAARAELAGAAGGGP